MGGRGGILPMLPGPPGRGRGRAVAACPAARGTAAGLAMIDWMNFLRCMPGPLPHLRKAAELLELRHVLPPSHAGRARLGAQGITLPAALGGKAQEKLCAPRLSRGDDHGLTVPVPPVRSNSGVPRGRASLSPGFPRRHPGGRGRHCISLRGRATSHKAQFPP